MMIKLINYCQGGITPETGARGEPGADLAGWETNISIHIKTSLLFFVRIIIFRIFNLSKLS
jgi:hypothetical protein